jgi:cytochrome b
MQSEVKPSTPADRDMRSAQVGEIPSQAKTGHVETGLVEIATLQPVTQVKIWDRFIRTFHWSLVVLFATAFYTRDKWEQIHIACGYAILALVLARIVWGFVGSAHARFSDFVYSPLTVMRFLVDTACFRAKRYLGHNPAGGAMVLALIVTLLTICGSGIAMTTSAMWGVKWIETIHEAATYGTLALIALHLIGVLLASVEHRENLIKAMLTGWKRNS